MTSFLHKQTSKCSGITKLTTIGTSHQGKPIYSLLMTETPDQSQKKPHVGLIGSLQGTDITGKELLLKLIEYLCNAYEQKEGKIIKLLHTTAVHILPAVDVDRNEKLSEGDCEGKLEPKDDLSLRFNYNLTSAETSSVPGNIAEVRSVPVIMFVGLTFSQVLYVRLLSLQRENQRLVDSSFWVSGGGLASLLGMG